MVEVLGGRGDWERKEQLAAALIEFLEGWVVRELCLHFRNIAECLYSETAEHRLTRALLKSDDPLSLTEMATRCGVSNDLLYPNGRIRRALERLERQGMVTNRGREGKPRYSLNRGNLKVQLISKIFEDPPTSEGLVAVALREGIGPHLD